jgi:outer membrane receptor protein involved in Fe transport
MTNRRWRTREQTGAIGTVTLSGKLQPNEHNDLPPKSRTKPTTARFDVINLFDKVYEIRDGSGIGVFAPQFGARRAFYAGLSQKF